MAFGDLLIFLPGISGSVLSRGGKDLWGTSSGAIFGAIASLGRTIKALELPPGAASDDRFDDEVRPSGLVQDLHLIPGLWKIDGYTKLWNYLVTTMGLVPGGNLFSFPYDWRFDNRRSARRLETFAMDRLRQWQEASNNKDAKIVFVAHSMGGLVSRYFIDCLGGWHHTRALISFGTPYRGSLNALGFLCNGYSKGVGPLKLDFSDVLRSFDSVYQLLPIYDCVDAAGDPQKPLSISAVDALPHLDQARVKAAVDFHKEIEQAWQTNRNAHAQAAAPYGIYPVIGTFQPTWQSALFEGGKVELLRSRRGKDTGGDGTVPRKSAYPNEQVDFSLGMFSENLHGSLQNIDAIHEQMRGVLTGLNLKELFRGDIEPRKDRPSLGLDIDDVYAAGKMIDLSVEPTILDELAGVRTPVRVAGLRGAIFDRADNRRVAQLAFRQFGEGQYRSDTSLPAGDYRIEIAAPGVTGPVSDSFVVVEEVD